MAISKTKKKSKKASGINSNAGEEVPQTDTNNLAGVFGMSEDDQIKLLAQIESEYQLAWWFIKPRWDEWMLRLKLYNNQKRNKDAVGDSLMFSTHQTLLAALYDDKLEVVFSPREGGDDEIAEDLTNLAQYDSELMHKDQLDFDWDWDTLFFGTGLCLFMEFNRELMTPIPEIIDPTTFLRDPRGRRMNGDIKGRGKLRFCGREIRMAKWEIEEAGVYHNFEGLDPTVINLQSLYDEAERLRQVAQGYSNVSQFKQLTGTNQDYLLLEWFTYFVSTGEKQSKLIFVTLGNERKQIIRVEEIKKKKIPIIERRIYPTSHEWDGASVTDFTEDKQRARAVVTNAALNVVRAGVHSKYIYDTTKITNKHDLDEETNKYIGVDGNPAGSIIIAPKDQVKNDVEYIMNSLAQNSEKALAVSELAQGILPQTKRLATEINNVQSHETTRYSLSAKIFGWSEKEFWETYYTIYKDNFKDGLDKKSMRISGMLGAKWRPLTRENLIDAVDPDVQVKSKALSDAERFNRLNVFQGFMNNTAADPSANKRGMEKYFGKLIGLKKDEIDYFLPPLTEELRARDENVLLEDNQKVEVMPNDDHFIHIGEHNKIDDNPYKIAHINAHLRALTLQKQRPELFPGGVQPSGMNPVPGAPEQQIQKPELVAGALNKGVGAQLK